MIHDTTIEQVYLAQRATDLRKSIDGLAAIVKEEFDLNPFSSSLFVFYNRSRDKVKILVWDHNGFWLYYHRLEKGTFNWPSEKDGIPLSVTRRQLRWLLDGLPLHQKQAHREFISKATVNGIRMHALDGAPEWVTDQKMQKAFLKWLNSYQKAALANEKFKGIHLDVELYEHEQYEEKPRDLLVRYQSMMITMRNQANTLNLEFGIDIPFWFYSVMYNNKYGKGNMAEWLCKHVECITIMAYRDTGAGTDGIIGISAAEMKLFHKYNVKGTIAVETGRLTEDYKFVTFYEEGKDHLYEQLNLVYEHYNAEPALYGIAIHHYNSWLAMP
ncbi:IS66 family insertion sequence element accessory protein TnpB [Peribacillus loiseleuriae]|uniref:IS66 family insertion sequence element accessory protein TnpB n=1 Tax=Peribacillus loiseleuriae TaxID=1679170 RepID=UPI003805B6E2